MRILHRRAARAALAAIAPAAPPAARSRRRLAPPWVAVAAGVAVAGAVAVPASASAAPRLSPVTGHAYLDAARLALTRSPGLTGTRTGR
jgi:hypothetical protein